MADGKRDKIPVAIYVRESRDEKLQNYETIETQRRLLEQYAHGHTDWQVVSVYEDDNISGTTFHRPGLFRLEQDMRNGVVQILLLKDLSRLGRNNGRTLLFLEFAEEVGVRIITADGRYDSATNTELAGIDTWFNERYAADISRKIRASLKYKIQAGQYIGTAPYGYKKTQSGGGLEPDPGKAFYVKRLYDLYLQGWGYEKLARLYNEEQVPPPRSRWSAQSIMRILRSPVYIGTTVQGVSYKLSYKSKKTARLPEREWVVTRGTHTPLISEQLFLAVQNERQKREHGHANNRGRLSPYKNLVYCGYCGSKMYSKAKGYLCSVYMKKGADCCRRCYVAEKEITETLLPALQREVQKITYWEDFGCRGAEQEAAVLEKECEKRLALLYNDRLSGVISLEQYKRLAEIEQRRLNRLQAEQQSFQADAKTLVEAFLQEVPETVEDSLLRAAAAAAVEKCTVK